MRKFIVDILRGSRPKPGSAKRFANRPPKVATKRKHIRVAAYVWRIQKTEGRAKAINEAAKHFGISTRTVDRALKGAETVSTRHTTRGPDGKATVKTGPYKIERPSAKSNKNKAKRRRSR
jgi:hypothetical protein